MKSQGKQIRGSIILLISKLSNEITPDTHKLAAGIELIHLASLIHDDIIDNANIRRDIKTVHKEFDLNNGIISGVHCYALALKLITSIKNNDILTTISDSVIDLCEGGASKSINDIIFHSLNQIIGQSLKENISIVQSGVYL